MLRLFVFMLLFSILAACGEARPTLVPATVAPTSPIAIRTPVPSNNTTLTWSVTPVAKGFTDPVFITHANDDSGRIFVVEQGGTIRTFDGKTFLDIRDRVNQGGSEQGLLGMAFAPDFKTSGRFYLNYTANNDDSITSRFTIKPDGTGDPASEEILFRIEDPAANHNGGMVAFGNDGYLYVGLGDGGGAGDRFGNGQNRNTLWGKLLRLDVSGATGYTAPSDNPFDGDDGRAEIWAYGLRNPWRFSFDSETGDLWLADVGQGALEEINFVPVKDQGGLNYGWNTLEGSSCYKSDGCGTEGLLMPVAEYTHGEGGCSVIGGYRYRGAQFPAMRGIYTYGDYCSGQIWQLREVNGTWQSSEIMDVPFLISSFGEDQNGEIYVAGYNDGVIYQLGAK